MSVYVDNFRAKFGRMIMCHMTGDTTEELLDMARRIGVNTKWFQTRYPWDYREHFDICLSKRKLAIELGAVPITFVQLGKMIVKRREQRLKGIYE